MKYNRKYGKLKENKLVYAPNILIDGDVQIINASADKYAEHGYLPIERTEPPEISETVYYTPSYTEANGRIIQQWEQHCCNENEVET